MSLSSSCDAAASSIAPLAQSLRTRKQTIGFGHQRLGTVWIRLNA
jgi:hypothetical protein